MTAGYSDVRGVYELYVSHKFEQQRNAYDTCHCCTGRCTQCGGGVGGGGGGSVGVCGLVGIQVDCMHKRHTRIKIEDSLLNLPSTI